jgi:hypothetical protein
VTDFNYKLLADVRDTLEKCRLVIVQQLEFTNLPMIPEEKLLKEIENRLTRVNIVIKGELDNGS